MVGSWVGWLVGLVVGWLVQIKKNAEGMTTACLSLVCCVLLYMMRELVPYTDSQYFIVFRCFEALVLLVP